jgi:hypothetical protein
MFWDEECPVYTAPHVNAARFVLDKPVILAKLESKNTIDIYD